MRKLKTPCCVAATIAAYTECDDWMYELNDYIQDNYRYLVEFFKTNFKDFKVAKLESTYLAWVDCSALNLTSKEITYKLLTSGKVYLNDGKMYHAPKEGFVRKLLMQGGKYVNRWPENHRPASGTCPCRQRD